MSTDFSFTLLPLSNYSNEDREKLTREGIILTSDGAYKIPSFLSIEISGEDYSFCPLNWQTKLDSGILFYFTDQERGYYRSFDLREPNKARLVLPTSKTLLGLLGNLSLSFLIANKT